MRATHYEALFGIDINLLVNRGDLEKVKTAEVGNIFNFGTQKTDEMGLFYIDKQGEKQSLHIGSYGIGVSRVMGVIAEKLSDDKGLVWPESVAPFKVYLVSIGDVSEQAEDLYNALTERGIEVLYDDRDERPGTKFADAELMGIPYRVTISERLVETENVELAERKGGEISLLTREALLAKLD